MVNIILDNNYSRLEGELSPYAHDKLCDTLCFTKKGCEHIESFQKMEWDGNIRLFRPGEPFLTGLLAPMVSILEDCKIPYKILDRRQMSMGNFPELQFTKPPWHEDREYQDFTIKRCIERTRGIIHIGTGGGKTVLVADLISRIKVRPFLFYVLTRDLLYQAKSCLSQCLNCEIGQIGDGIVDIKDINVCTKDAVVYAINKNVSTFNIQNYKFDSCDVWDEKEIYGESDTEKIVDVVKNCRGIYFDECVSGDCKIETEAGEELFVTAMENKRKFVKTYDGNNVTYRRILNWWKKGKRQTVVIECNGASIRCTTNHLIFTRTGWKMAGELNVEDWVLCANVGAELGSQTETTENQENTCSDIKLRAELPNSGDPSTKILCRSSQNASCVEIRGMKNGSCCFPLRVQPIYPEELKSTFPNTCNTNWFQISQISKGSEEEVFDIEVEQTHCFFANSVLVHNCHHASSATCKDIMLASPRAYWRYGGTATIEREDGEELVIQGLFGRRIVNISLSYLIKHNWLVPAGVFFVPIEFKEMPYTSYQEIYSYGVSKNEKLISSISEFSQYLAELGKSSLILVSKISHGKVIKSRIPEAQLLTGKDSSKKRNKVIEDMRSGKLKILIATTLADEGLDIPRLDVVHMVGAGASVTRVPQRVGRVVRRFPGKRYGIAIYYHYCTRYLYQHGMKAKRIVKQDEAIDVIQTADLDDLREKILQYMFKKESLFSVA